MTGSAEWQLFRFEILTHKMIWLLFACEARNMNWSLHPVSSLIFPIFHCQWIIGHATDILTDWSVNRYMGAYIPRTCNYSFFQIRTSPWLQFKIQTSKEEEISFQIRDRQTRTFKGPWYNFVSPCNPIFIHSLFNLDSSLILFKCMSRLRSRLSDPW